MLVNMSVMKFSNFSICLLFISSAFLVNAQQIASTGDYDKHWYEVPVLKLNFYMMGMDSVDESITLKIGENVEYLNQEFEGKVKFELNGLVLEKNHAYLPDLHIDFFKQRGQRLRKIIHPIEEQGAINVFLFETYRPEDQQSALLGFTPILRMRQSSYDANSPRFDRIFMAYPGLDDMSTLVHEMGHFLGLRHPWEMNHIDQELMGLNSTDKKQVNHMSYEFAVSEFTTEQLERMRDFALRFRHYLVKEIEQQFN